MINYDPEPTMSIDDALDYLQEAIDTVGEMWGYDKVVGYLNSYVTNYMLKERK